MACRGTYHQSVTVNKSLRLVGRTGAVINAAGFSYGVGMTASYVTVTGLTVENAQGGANDPNDGIITAGFGPMGPVAADHETIVANVLKNASTNNGIGINMSNDLGKTASHNQILGNIANNNPVGCGLVLADHFGILAGGSGGVYNNVVPRNFFTGNGHGGIALHAHAPGLNFSGNQILSNTIGPNNVRTDFADLKTTGIYLGDVSKLSIKISGNTFRNSFYGIFTAGPVTVNGLSSNGFFSVTHPLGHVAAYAG